MESNENNILYIPIQINGGTTLPNDLLERELFIKNGELYVGTGSGKKEMIIGRVVPGAIIENATLKSTLFLDGSLVVSSASDVKNPTNGQIVFVDEGQY